MLTTEYDPARHQAEQLAAGYRRAIDACAPADRDELIRALKRELRADLLIVRESHVRNLDLMHRRIREHFAVAIDSCHR